MFKKNKQKNIQLRLKSDIKTTRGLRKGISRKDLKGEGEQAQQNNPGKTCKNISMIKLIKKKNKKWSAYKRGQLLKLGIILFSAGITPRYFTNIIILFEESRRKMFFK